ncbi:MAG: cytochrome c [Pacificimonas sp.]
MSGKIFRGAICIGLPFAAVNAGGCSSLSSDQEVRTANPQVAWSDLSAVERGKQLVERECVSCHARLPGERSPHDAAPSFATLFTHYPPDYIAEAFTEGVFVGHGDMPPFEFEAGEIDDLVAYLTTLDNAR